MYRQLMKFNYIKRFHSLTLCMFIWDEYIYSECEFRFKTLPSPSPSQNKVSHNPIIVTFDFDFSNPPIYEFSLFFPFVR